MDEEYWTDSGCLFCDWMEGEPNAPTTPIIKYIFCYHGYCCRCGKRIV